MYRFLTRPSFPESSSNASDVHHPWADAGLSEDTQRRLLLSQNSVTARFEAQKLWDEGYGGAKVKVGVFDTGIRADHPHVKNIRWASVFDSSNVTVIYSRPDLDAHPLAKNSVDLHSLLVSACQHNTMLLCQVCYQALQVHELLATVDLLV